MDSERRRSRRVQRPGVPGADPTPQAVPDDPVLAGEDTDSAWGDRPRSSDSNDDRLRRDVPPHWQ